MKLQNKTFPLFYLQFFSKAAFCLKDVKGHNRFYYRVIFIVVKNLLELVDLQVFRTVLIALIFYFYCKNNLYYSRIYFMIISMDFVENKLLEMRSGRFQLSSVKKTFVQYT